MTVCINVIIPLNNQNITNNFPPFFNAAIDEPIPIVVKNTTIKGSCKVVSYFIVPIPNFLIIRCITANNIPPITGAGIPNLLKNLE